ncbi:hypothetical protein AVEN_45495-1 [Araneus ventricosus]|uniref:Uncharacterized protein n=1 Tax=Araneus ventricosus TaxID=182803 RepID=A0A4Y2JPL3_ARAVE|nr:hypothetical protein AVEN_45495-1 [Araneus ventricosus]
MSSPGKSSVCPSLQPKGFLRQVGHMSLPPERLPPKFRTRYFRHLTANLRHPLYFYRRGISSIFFLTGPCFAEKRRSTGAGEKGKGTILSPLLLSC